MDALCNCISFCIRLTFRAFVCIDTFWCKLSFPWGVLTSTVCSGIVGFLAALGNLNDNATLIDIDSYSRRVKIGRDHHVRINDKDVSTQVFGVGFDQVFTFATSDAQTGRPRTLSFGFRPANQGLLHWLDLRIA